MIHILSDPGREAIRALARDRALLAFDFDGTLAPIVEDPDAARLGSYARALLRALSLLFPCAVISGRARDDLARRLAGLPRIHLVGNHGAEGGPVPPADAVGTQVREWASALRAALAGKEGVEVEEKGFTIAVHYRRARFPDEARSRIARAVAALGGARVFGGHAVVNIAPLGAPTKADAIRAFAARFPPTPVLYVGDDETDEDAFRSPIVTCAVRVGSSDSSAARYYVRDRAEVDRLLWSLVSERARSLGLREGWQDLDPARNAGGAG